jgi:putative flippase GtrA
VSLISGWYRRFRHLIHEVAKFGVIGAIGFLVTEGVFNLLIHDNAPSFTANAVATLVAAAVTFAGNRYWTFRHRERTGMGRETAVFIVLNLIGILIQQACIEVAKHTFGGHDKFTLNAGFLVGVALATLFRFWSYRKWVWLGAPAGPGTGTDERRPSGAGPGGGQEDREPEMVPPAPPGSAAQHHAAQHQRGPVQAPFGGRRDGPRHSRRS